jgi:hypothetical protein
MSSAALIQYEVRNGVVVPFLQGTRASLLEVLETTVPDGQDHPGLPGEFANVATGDEQVLLEFFQRYGMLGFERYVGVEEAVRQGLYNRKNRGDPVRWVVTHAGNVKMILRLTAALQSQDELKDILRSMSDDHREVEVPHVEWASPKRGSCIVSTEYEPLQDLRRTALTIITTSLSRNLSGSQRNLEIEGAQRHWHAQNSFRSRTLLDRIYWLLADAVTGQRVRTCANPRCERPFIVTHESEAYCPPAGGMKGVSPCMNRDKVRRARKKRIALTLRRQRVPVKVIAQRVGEDLVTVKDWLRRPFPPRPR